MPQPKIKICGLSRPEDVDAVNAARPDYIGFVFAPGSRRRVTPEQAAALRARLDAGIVPVGVFVDAEVDEIAALVAAGTIEAVQLHGREDAAYVRVLRDLLPEGTAVIKAMRLDSLPLGGESGADYILLDHGSGGTGEAFDWRLLDGRCADGCIDGVPFFLAGGVNEGNLEEALALGPYAVDVSSGAETDGVKDAGKISRLVAAVRGSKGRKR
ncbi:MAG: phosphoribosylanthranilate isomerase [Clostridiales Family XIII bacterium]|jgi:phosphoribosylanthranilate isomerase|nr:phosphoribosylanthranilate isomerase [Clostridiales Family XIII bacterium]